MRKIVKQIFLILFLGSISFFLSFLEQKEEGVAVGHSSIPKANADDGAGASVSSCAGCATTGGGTGGSCGGGASAGSAGSGGF